MLDGLWGRRKPDDFNWVEARAKLPRGVFADLAKRVEADVKEANDYRSDLVPRCEFGWHGSSVFRVWYGGHPDGGCPALATFELDELQRIKVSRRCPGEPKGSGIVGAPVLQRDGDLVIEVDDQALALWQFSRLALEPLFFS